MAGLVVSLECKELGFRYEFEDSQGVFLKVLIGRKITFLQAQMDSK